MAQPADILNWASDTNFTTGPESGTPTKVDPGATYEAQGFVPDDAFVGPYVNWALNNVSLWLAYLKNLDADSYFLGRAYSWTAAHVWSALGRFTAGLRASAIQLVTGGDMLYTDAAGASAPRLRLRSVPLRVQNENATVAWAGGGSSITMVNLGGAYIPLTQHDLPQGASMQTARAWGHDDGGTLTIEFGYWEITHSSGVAAYTQLGVSTRTGTNAFLDYNFSAGTGGTYVNHTIDWTNRRYIFYINGNNITSGGSKYFTDVYVTFNDVGFVGN